MLCPYIRSSSMKGFEWCQHKYALEYFFGFKSESGKKATLGTMFHRVMQLRADCKIAIQEGKTEFEDDDFGLIKVSHYKNLDFVIDDCYRLYANRESHISWSRDDRDLVAKWVRKSLKKQSAYDPIKLNIVASELFFDLPIDEEWAHYSDTIGGEKIEGQLRIKGTMDLLIDRGAMYEYYDYKSGKQINYTTGKKLEYTDLYEDKQILLYFLALKTLYPDKDFIMTLNYVNGGGLLSVPMDTAHLARAKRLIRSEFEKINKCFRPQMHDPTNKDWKCRICSFSKWDPNLKTTKCKFIAKEIKDKGLHKTVSEYGDISKLGVYGDGGGRTNSEGNN